MTLISGVSRLSQTVAAQREEIRDLRHQVTQLTLAAAVLSQRQAGPQSAPAVLDNVVPLRPGEN